MEIVDVEDEVVEDEVVVVDVEDEVVVVDVENDVVEDVVEEDVVEDVVVEDDVVEDDGVEDDHELTHYGGDDDLVGLALGLEALGVVFERRAVLDG